MIHVLVTPPSSLPATPTSTSQQNTNSSPRVTTSSDMSSPTGANGGSVQSPLEELKSDRELAATPHVSRNSNTSKKKCTIC